VACAKPKPQKKACSASQAGFANPEGTNGCWLNSPLQLLRKACFKRPLVAVTEAARLKLQLNQPLTDAEWVLLALRVVFVRMQEAEKA
jgi:hypothetical protein